MKQLLLLPLNIDEKPDTDIDVAGFQEAWETLKDTHAFFGMLKKFGVTRTQALTPCTRTSTFATNR